MQNTKIVMPKLGQAMTEGVVVRWHRTDGERVAAAALLVTVETDKATYDLEAPASGTLHVRVQEGEEVPIHTVLAEIGDAPAQARLGWMYASGQSLPQDETQAVHWYRQATDQGHADAQFNLGRMYADGRGVPQDATQAVHWFRRAADQGHADAQFNLGRMYDDGRGVPQDETQAVHWFRQATDQGSAGAQKNLGMMYAEGRGVPQDNVAAYAWYNLAASNGNEEAADLRDALARNMTPTQLATTQRRTQGVK